ncbi:hypothetical protein V7S43_013545 [Phytophthora oleae]|uniref:Uncharacterized protein n=1 Tax=Phytophthora oleae TaxID=2107226 RepID=A0ABD3F496_9STRA
MGLKKAPLLGSSGSVGETGLSVIDGDRRLLSHFGTSSDREIGPLNVATRKSAALRRNFVARGLARQYSDQKVREESFKTQVPRYQRQQKILENYQRVQAHRDAIKEADSSDRHEDSGDGEDYSENVVLVVSKRSNSAPGSSSSQSKRHISPVVPPKRATSFLRHSNTRQLRENQDEDASDKDSTSFRLKPSPSEADIPHTQLRPVPRQQTNIAGSETQGLSKNVSTGPAPWLPTARRSSRMVLSELSITKDIMMREQLLRQLKEALVLVDCLPQEFLRSQNELKQAQTALEAAKAMSPSGIKKTGSLIGLTLLSPVDEDFARNAVAEAEVAVTESNAQLADATKRLRHHIRHVGLLIGGLQQSTLSVVEGILDWRQMRQRRRQMSNFQRLFRFPWRRRRIPNYLLHLNEDLRSLFPSVSLELLLGPKAVYNPLLLSRSILQSFGTSSAGKTFLTERDWSNSTASKSPTKGSSPDRRKQNGISSVGLKRLQELLGSFSPPKPSVDYDRLQQCLEAIYREEEMEALEKQRCGEEELRAETTYDPFSTVKSAGGVEETLTNMMVLQSPTSHLLGEQLRIRQEDTTRAVPETQSTQKKSSTKVFQINPERLRDFLDKQAAALQPVGDCELRDVQKWGMKNKLQGKLMVRKNNERRVENLLARKIQLQYLAYRSRNALQSHLTHFVQRVRDSVVNIQRIFRGHRTKRAYNCIRSAWLEHKRQVSAVRTIVNAFRRYRRRLRHRRSMTVESIAQAQLITLLASKSSESETEQERYRRVGEERRRQRIVLLQKHKMEQQEIERKRIAAAVQMQAVVRAHLAQGQAKLLRQEKKAHMTAVSAMAIQSTIRTFLNTQQDRRQRFRKDLERVNQSAVRIQSIYRGYNSRASLLGQLDEQSRQSLNSQFMAHTLQEGETDDEDDDEEEEESEEEEEEELDQVTSVAGFGKGQEDKLPLIVVSCSRPSSGKRISFVDEKTVARTRTPSNPVSLPPLWPRDGSSSSLLSSTSSSGTGRRISVGMMRVELKLKEAEIGDTFATPPSRRNSLVGSVRHQT